MRPGAALAILVFVLSGTLACAGWIYWLWYTLWEYPCGHTPRQCACDYYERNGLK